MHDANARQAADPNEVFDCQACGACCVEAGAVILADEDDVPAPMVQHVANLCCMATEGTSFRCVALLGTVGRSVGCGIYLRRPDVNAIVHLHPQTSVLLTALGHDIALITRDRGFRHFAKHCGLRLA